MREFKLLSIAATAAILFIGCNPGNKHTDKEHQTPLAAQDSKHQKGEEVPAQLVCMVNDVYMGKEQLAVPFEGKTYYGCCEMCRKRIPEDSTVRYATDPQTLKQVDKARAYIVLISEKGAVAYFEDKVSYLKFTQENK